jgi:hypothetical protein
MQSNLSTNTTVVLALLFFVRRLPSFDLSAKEVLQFCTECVLNEDEDSECEIPEAFFDDLMP